MDRIEVEEIVTGLIITGKKTDINVEFLSPEALEMVEKFNKGSTVEELISSHGELALSAIHAAQSLNGSVNYNWNEILQLSVKKDELIQQLEWKVKDLRDGKDVDFADLDLEMHPDTGIQCAANVEAMEIPLMKSGFAPIDEVIGGIPMAGIESVLAYTSTGKTTYALGRVDAFLSQHKDRNALVLSTEMLEEENKMRLIEIGAKNIDRIYLYNYQNGVRGIVPLAKQVKNLGFLVVDMLDDVVTGEVSEPKMSEVWQTLSKASRELRIPILVTALPHRAQNKVLRPHNFRWSSMAEGRSYMITSIYNPMKNTVNGVVGVDPLLPRQPGIAWICVWKVRGGGRVEKYSDMTQLAIPVEWRPDLGFRNKITKKCSVFSLEDDKD